MYRWVQMKEIDELNRLKWLKCGMKKRCEGMKGLKGMKVFDSTKNVKYLCDLVIPKSRETTKTKTYFSRDSKPRNAKPANLNPDIKLAKNQ